MLIVLFMTASVISFAQEADEMKGSMMGKGMMMGMCPMHSMMMKMMMGKSLVATEDGGIVVMSGNKLMKYDKDLNLKKEVELKMDMAGMQKMMERMMEKCPMRKMMMEKGMMTGEDVEEATELDESSMPSEHEAHH
jgi:hypothetical protein